MFLSKLGGGAGDSVASLAEHGAVKVLAHKAPSTPIT